MLRRPTLALVVAAVAMSANTCLSAALPTTPAEVSCNSSGYCDGSRDTNTVIPPPKNDPPTKPNPGPTTPIDPMDSRCSKHGTVGNESWCTIEAP
jgi:hypothetical protein